MIQTRNSQLKQPRLPDWYSILTVWKKRVCQVLSKEEMSKRKIIKRSKFSRDEEKKSQVKFFFFFASMRGNFFLCVKGKECEG